MQLRCLSRAVTLAALVLAVGGAALGAAGGPTPAAAAALTQFTPNPAIGGQAVTVNNACGLTSGGSISVTVTATDGTAYQFGNPNVTSLDNGCYNVSWTLPSFPTGTYTVTVSDGTNQDSGPLPVSFAGATSQPAATSATYQPAPYQPAPAQPATTASFQLTPYQVAVGQPVTAYNACGFGGAGSMYLSVTAVNGVVYQVPNADFFPLGNGCYNASFVMPSLPYGYCTVIIGNGSIITRASLKVKNPTIAVPPLAPYWSFQYAPYQLAYGQPVTAYNACGLSSALGMYVLFTGPNGYSYTMRDANFYPLGNGCYNAAFNWPTSYTNNCQVTIGSGSYYLPWTRI